MGNIIVMVEGVALLKVTPIRLLLYIIIHYMLSIFAAFLKVQPNQLLYIFVGGQGLAFPPGTMGQGNGGSGGGFNGGGNVIDFVFTNIVKIFREC